MLTHKLVVGGYHNESCQITQRYAHLPYTLLIISFELALDRTSITSFIYTFCAQVTMKSNSPPLSEIKIDGYHK